VFPEPRRKGATLGARLSAVPSTSPCVSITMTRGGEKVIWTDQDSYCR